jgi:PAS domain S-box-containing protein
MKLASGSLAFRLAAWFFVLSLLPLAGMMFFLSRSVSNEFIEQAAHFRLEEAQLLAQQVTDGHVIDLSEWVIEGDADHHRFVLSAMGIYLAHSDPGRVGEYYFNDFSAETRAAIFSGRSGTVVDRDFGYAIGYVWLPGNERVVVSIVSLNEIDRLMFGLQNMTYIQLAISMIIVALAGGVVIWIVVGGPLRVLTIAAREIGEGQLDVEINADGMEAELSVLARTINKMAGELRTLVRGLEQRVRELKQAQETITQSEQRFRVIFDSINDAVFVQDYHTGAILDVNNKMIEMYGYSRAEALGLDIDAISLGKKPYTRAEAMAYLQKAARTGSHLYEWLARDKNGRLFWVEVNMRTAVIDGIERALVVVRDVTERKRAEQVRIALYRISQAAQSSNNLTELFRLIHDIINELMSANNFYIALYDANQQEIYYPYYADEFDATPDPHPLGHGLTAYVLRSGKPSLVTPEIFAELVAAGEVESIGAPSVDWLGVPLLSARGVLGVMTTQTYNPEQRLAQDDLEVFSLIATQVAMTVERKRAEDLLRESEARWRTLMANAPQLILTIDKEGRILFVNRSFPGFEQEETIGRSLFDFTRPASVVAVQQKIRRVFMAGISESFEMPVVAPDGRIYWYACNLAPLAIEVRIDLGILNATDITERKNAEDVLREREELYRRAIGAAGSVPYYLDHIRHEYTFIGEGIKELTGYEPNEFTPQVWDSLVRETRMVGSCGLYTLEEAIQKNRAGLLPLWQADSRICDRNGEERWIFDGAVNILDEEGRLVGSIGTLQDISLRKSAEDQIRRMNDELEQRVRERTKELESFSYSVSHDLRQPLRALDGYSRFLMSDYGDLLPEEGQHYVNIIRQNAQQMGRLIDDLLAFSRLGRQAIQKETVNCTRLVEEVLEQLYTERAGRDLQIQIQELSPCHGDPALIRQVWVNLISNAIKFTQKRAPAVVEIGQFTREHERVYYVKDNGAGFDMKYAEKLFNVFQRLHRSEEFDGTGVGLAIVHRIVRKHGGRIWAEARVNEGATFFFTIP